MGAFLRRRETLFLLGILVFSTIVSLFLFKGLSIYGDDPYYTQYVPSVLNGTFKETINIFSLRLLVDVPVAISVLVLGYTDIAAGIWALISYLVTIGATYVIGKELYDSRAGLLAALLFAIYPLSLHYNTSPSPMLPLAMFLSLSLQAFIRGRKKRSVGYYILSGALGFMGTLANPLAYLYFVFYVFYFIGDAVYGLEERGKLKPDYKMLGVFLGLLTAIAAMGFINIWLALGSPFFELGLTNSYYSAAGGPDEIFYTNPSLTYYINGFFPYDITQRIVFPLLSLNIQLAISGVAFVLQGMLSSQQLMLNEVGIFGYAFVAAGAYLAFRRERRAYFALILASFLALYMEFGSMSITHYFPIYKLMRFTVILAVPLALILGIALSAFIRKKHGVRFGARIFAATAIVLLLFITSLPLDYLYYIFNHNTMLFVREMALVLNRSVSGNAHVLAPALIPFYLSYYMNYRENVSIGQYDNGAYNGLFLPTCASIPNNTYLVIPSRRALEVINSYGLWNVNESWASDPSLCNLRLYADIYNASGLKSLGLYDPAYTGNLYYKN